MGRKNYLIVGFDSYQAERSVIELGDGTLWRVDSCTAKGSGQYSVVLEPMGALDVVAHKALHRTRGALRRRGGM